jgi:hypothetical protein
VEYNSTAEAIADGWGLLQYSIQTDAISVRGPDGLAPAAESFTSQTITVAGLPMAAIKL